MGIVALSEDYQWHPLSPADRGFTLIHVKIRARSGKIALGASVAAGLAALMLLVSPAAATPEDVIVDYRADGVISESHSADDLYDALVRWRETGAANYGAFDEAVSEALDRITLGIAPSRSDPPGPGEQRSDEITRPDVVAPAVGLPSPPATGDAAEPPVAFLALSALGLLLVLAGTGAALSRRLRRND